MLVGMIRMAPSWRAKLDLLVRPKGGARRASLRKELLRLARDEALALLVLWLALAVPVVCQHGPMSLLFPGVHETSAAGHAGHVLAPAPAAADRAPHHPGGLGPR